MQLKIERRLSLKIVKSFKIRLMKKLIFRVRKYFLFYFFLFACHAHAQKVAWDKYIGGNYQDYLADVVATGDNGFLLAGSSLSTTGGLKNSENRGGLDFWLWKMNEQGDLDWQKSFGGHKTDMLHQVQHTKDGGFILVGTSDSDISFDKKQNCFGETDIWVVKLNAKGAEEWQLTLGGHGYENNPSIVQTKDGGFAIACSSSSGISGNKTSENYGSLDYWLVKLNLKGEIIWQQNYGGQWADHLVSLIQTADGGLLLGGHSNSNASGNKTQDALGMNDYWLIKTNATGQMDWQKTFGGNKDESLTALVASKNGGYLLGGSTNSETEKAKVFGKTKTAMQIIKLDEQGVEIWSKQYNYGQTNLLTTIIENEDLTLTIGGYAKGAKSLSDGLAAFKTNDANTEDFLVVKLNANGDYLWDKIIKNESEDVLKKIINTYDGGFLLAGTSMVLDSQIRANSKRQGSQDFWLLKMTDESIPTRVMETLKAIPNPTTGFTNIFVGQAFTKGQMTVVDLMGRQILSQTVDQRIIPLDMNQWQAGVYVINIKIGKDQYTTKVIKD